MNPANSPGADWLQPPEEQEGLRRYVETIRERLWLIVVTVAITAGIALLYVLTATKTYQAEADMLISPVAAGDPVTTSLGLIRESSDPTQDVETASRLVTNIDVAESVRKAIHSNLSAQALLSKVSAAPVASSNFVAVTATDTSPQAAKQLADSFAQQAVADRTQQMHAQIDRQLPRLQAQAGTAAGAQAIGTTGSSIDAQIAELQLLRSGPDPTMKAETLATLPTSPSSPKKTLSIVAGIVAGLILGIGAAFAAQVLDPRLRREAQLRRLYRLPVLGRIPREAHSRSEHRPLGPKRLSPVAAEAYRTLRSTLTSAPATSGGRVILITGSSPSEGKTTTAVNLATSLALSGKRVILIESDLRRPVLGATLGARPVHGGVVSVLIEKTELSEALTQTETYGPNLELLLADYEGGWIAELFSIPSAERMIEDARRMADFVIVASPPLNEVVDALPLARLADDVLIVVRLGTTRLDKLAVLGELLAENGVRPAGFAVVGIPRPGRGQYHYYASDGVPEQDRGRRRRSIASRSRNA